MISINKQGNAIVIEFTDNDKYLFDGTIEVAPNELMVVTDKSDMATFKRSTNGDTLFSQLIDQIQIGGNPVTKDTILNEFAKIGFQTGSSTEWDYTKLIAYTKNYAEYGDNFFNSAKVGESINSVSINNQVYDAVITSIYNTSSTDKLYSLLTANVSVGPKVTLITVNFTAKTASILTTFDLSKIPVDSELSNSSTNPVQNKVVTKALSEKLVRTVANLSTYTQLLNPATWITNIPGYSSNTTGMVINNPTVTSANAIVKGSDGYHLIELTQGADTNWLYKVTSDISLSVDTEMSSTSVNAVQNKVIKQYVDGLIGDINTVLDQINGEVI